eukprot:c20879_g1_i3.p1 GENE.c20879_g1_i3~~c20879_g1_i3.p1  ORF type:complete len:670 (+),score=207.19 c20879_g1_i3:71-2080(+)
MKPSKFISFIIFLFLSLDETFSSKPIEIKVPSNLQINSLRLIDKNIGIDTRLLVAVWLHPKPLMTWQLKNPSLDNEIEISGEMSLNCTDSELFKSINSRNILNNKTNFNNKTLENSNIENALFDIFPKSFVRDPFSNHPDSLTLPNLGMHSLYDGTSNTGTHHLLILNICDPLFPTECSKLPQNNYRKELSQCDILFQPFEEPNIENSTVPKNESSATHYPQTQIIFHSTEKVPEWIRFFRITHRINHLINSFHIQTNQNKLPTEIPTKKKKIWTLPSTNLLRGDEAFIHLVSSNSMVLASEKYQSYVNGGDLESSEFAASSEVIDHDDLDVSAQSSPIVSLNENQETDDLYNRNGDKNDGVQHGFLSSFGGVVQGELQIPITKDQKSYQSIRRHKAAIEKLKSFQTIVPENGTTNANDEGSNNNEVSTNYSFLEIASGSGRKECENGHRICDIGGTSSLSSTICLSRIRSDIKSSLLLDVQEAVHTQAASIIKAILPPLLLALLTPLIMLLIQLCLPFVCEHLVPPVQLALQPTVILACMGLIDTALGQAIEATLYQILAEGMKNILRRALTWAVPRAIKKTLPRAIVFYVLNFESISYAKPIAHGVVHMVTQSFTQQAASVLPKAISNSVQHALMARLQRYEYCVYCYYQGKYCDECDSSQKIDPSQ